MRKIVLALLLLLAHLLPAAAQPAPVPALPDSERRTQYSISASTGPLNVGFQIYADDGDPANWIQVYVNGVKTTAWTLSSPSGSVSTIARPITNAQITFTTAQTGTVQIVGAQRPRRLAEFAENRGVAARDLNQTVNSLEAQLREVWDLRARTGLVAEPGFVWNTLPIAAARAGLYVCFDGTGQQTVCSGSPGTSSLAAGTGITLTGSNPTTIAFAPGSGAYTWSGVQKFMADVCFGSGRPYFDVRCFGAKGDAVTDDSAAFQAAIAAASAVTGGLADTGSVYVPPGYYCLKTPTSGTAVLQINAAIHLFGSTRQHIGSLLGTCGADVTVMNVNAPDTIVETLQVLGKGAANDPQGTFGASHPAILADVNCVFCEFRTLFVQGGNPAILLKTADIHVEDSAFSYSYGSAQAIVFNNSTAINAWFWRSSFDQNPPLAAGFPLPTATISAWQAGHLYSTTGTVVSTGGWNIELLSAGTSGGSPPTMQNYGLTINDGTAQWGLVGPGVLAGIQLDAGSSEVVIDGCDLSGVYSTPLSIGYFLGSQTIGNTRVSNSTMGGALPQSIAVNAKGGARLAINNSELYANVGMATGASTFGAFTGTFLLSNNFIVDSTAGIETQTGETNFSIIGNEITGTGTGVVVGKNNTNFVISGNLLSGNTTPVSVDTGSDYFNVVNNIFHGTSINDASGCAHCTKSGNN